MKKSIILLLIFISGILLTACGKSSDSAVERIRNNGVLNVGITQSDTMLLQKGPDGTSYSGTEMELVQYIADALGVKVAFAEINEDELFNVMKAGQIDIAIGSIPYDGSMAYNYGISTPYASGFIYVVTPKGYYADSLGSFADSTVGVSEAFSATTTSIINAIDDVKLNRYSSLEDVSEDLTGGTIKGYFCHEKEADELLAMGSFQVQNLLNTDKEEYVILTRAEDQDLLAGINSLIAQFIESKKEGTETDAEAEPTQTAAE